MNNQDYFEDQSRWGEGQRVSVKEVVDTYMARLTNDHYMSNITRVQVYLAARSIMRELYFDVVKQVKIARLQISPNLSVVLPQDYVALARLSWIDEAGNIYPMTVNNKNKIANDYLQADNYEYLYDEEGERLNAQTFNEMVVIEDEYGCIKLPKTQQMFYEGTYVINHRDNTINFSNDIQEKEVIIEYISDGLEKIEPSKMFIHKMAEKALRNGITYELMQDLRNVPDYEKRRSKKEYYNEKRKSKARINAVNYAELLRVLTISG